MDGTTIPTSACRPQQKHCPGYSRIYDDDHYLSQVLLGYTIAVLAVDATELTQQSPFQYRVVPINGLGGTGIGVEFRR